MPKKILFLVPYPLGESPSQRFRFEQYFEILRQDGFSISVDSFLNSHNWQIFFKPGKSLLKAWVLFSGFTRRWLSVFRSPFYDFVFIHREATPLGPPVAEWIIAKVFRRKIIYDFDDAIWATDRINEPAFLRILKWRSKVSSTCRWAYKVSCGNTYLMNYAAQFSKRVVYMPTTIDTENWHNPELFDKRKKNDISITIGWTGTHSTLKYLNDLVPVLKSLENKYPQAELVVIADKKPDYDLTALRFIPWTKEKEIEDLMKIDIGIMPLPDDEWSKGKCGFKALQYMALNIPSVISPVGVNTSIIDHGENGFLATSPEEWFLILEKLINQETLRKDIGAKSRQKIISHYSVLSQASSFVSLFG